MRIDKHKLVHCQMKREPPFSCSLQTLIRLDIVLSPSNTYTGEDSLYLSVAVSDPEAFSVNVSNIHHVQNNTKTYEVRVYVNEICVIFVPYI